MGKDQLSKKSGAVGMLHRMYLSILIFFIQPITLLLLLVLQLGTFGNSY